MSGLAALLQLDSRPVTRPAFEALLRRLAHRGPDGCEGFFAGCVALGHLHLWATPEEVGERQPVSDARGEVHLTFDGRLDNRRELLDALQPRGGAELSDAALVVESYRRWGRDCLARLLGPFALALWDARRRALLCGRDALGDRSLFYTRSGTALAVASEEGALLAVPGVSREPDEETLARFFACREPSAGRTFYAAIRELPPAHGLWLEGGRLELFEHWAPDWSKRIRYRDDGEYAEHFRELLERSVRRRLRSPSRPAVLMSGGLDSTSLATLAARRIAADRGEKLTALTWIFDRLASCDERSFARAVARRSGLSLVELPADDLWPLGDEESEPVSDSSPTANPYRRLLDRAYRAARDEGCRALLTGWSGDHLWLGGERWIADLIREGRLGEAAVEALYELAIGRSPHRVAASLAGLLRLRRPWRPRITTRSHPWLTPLALDRLRASEDGEDDPRRRRFAGLQVWNLVAERAHAARMGIETRHPYRDRELVEAMLAMPAHQLYRRGRPKHLLRQALGADLPDEVLDSRADRGRLDPLFRRGVFERERDKVQGLLTGDRALWSRYVDPRWAERAARPAGGEGLHAVITWSCACAELWNRRRAA